MYVLEHSVDSEYNFTVANKLKNILTLNMCGVWSEDAINVIIFITDLLY